MDATFEVKNTLELSHPWGGDSRSAFQQLSCHLWYTKFNYRDKNITVTSCEPSESGSGAYIKFKFEVRFNNIMVFGLLFLKSALFPLTLPNNLHVFLIPYAFNTSILSYFSAHATICYVLRISSYSSSFPSSCFILSFSLPHSLQHSLLKYSSVCVLFRSYVATVN
jgi:hypothetical protein